MSVLFSACVRNCLPFPHGCRLDFLVWTFLISQYFSFGKEKRKSVRRKTLKQNKKPKLKKPSKTSLMKILDFNQLHHCREYMRSSHGLSWSLRALPAVHELTFTREGSLGIAHANHVSEGCAAVKGTARTTVLPGKFPSGHAKLGWTQQEILKAAGWKVFTGHLCWQHPVKTCGEQSDTSLFNLSATLEEMDA